jgi:hypothetical protein
MRNNTKDKENMDFNFFGSVINLNKFKFSTAKEPSEMAQLILATALVQNASTIQLGRFCDSRFVRMINGKGGYSYVNQKFSQEEIKDIFKYFISIGLKTSTSLRGLTVGKFFRVSYLGKIHALRITLGVDHKNNDIKLKIDIKKQGFQSNFLVKGKRAMLI